VLRWLAAHARGLRAELGLLLGLGMAAAATALALFALLARGVAAGTTRAIDEAVLRWAASRSADWLDALALVGAVLGSGTAAWAVLIVGTVVLWRRRQPYSVLLLWAALLGARLLNAELKLLFRRPRPAPGGGEMEILGRHFAFPTSPSFPSGHALTSVVVFGTLAYLVARLEPGRRQRRQTMAAAAGLILLIGLSRVYLRVHYPSDVLAGYLAGAVWTFTCALAVEVLRYARTPRS
jgi:undecaprenyl-diphosphatase